MKLLSRGGQAYVHQYGTGNSRLIIKRADLKVQGHGNILYEAEMLSKAQGNGVVKLLGVEYGKTPKIALEYIRGKNFLEQIHSCHDQEKNIENLVKSIPKIAINLGRVHSRNIIHGDVKPDNVFNRQKGATWIDFGYSHQMNSNRTFVCDSKEDISGTEGFMHPWIFEDGVYSEQTDVWALMGVTLYAITGKYSKLDDRITWRTCAILGLIPSEFHTQEWKDFFNRGFDRETGGYVDVSEFLEYFPE